MRASSSYWKPSLLRRSISACGANCAPTSSFGNVELISPGVAYEDRQQSVDLRFTRVFRAGRANVRPSLDLSNLLNAGSIYAANPGVGNAQPQVNLFNLNVDLGDLIPRGQSQFLYMWTGFGGSDE